MTYGVDSLKKQLRDMQIPELDLKILKDKIARTKLQDLTTTPQLQKFIYFIVKALERGPFPEKTTGETTALFNDSSYIAALQDEFKEFINSSELDYNVKKRLLTQALNELEKEKSSFPLLYEILDILNEAMQKMRNLAGLQDNPATTTSELFATILLSKNISKDINALYGASFQEMEKHHSSKSLFEIAKEIPKKSGRKLS